MEKAGWVGDAVLNSIKKNVNVPALGADLLDNIVEKALKDAVEKSGTKLDDIAFGALYPVLESELKNQLKILWESLLSQKEDESEPVYGEPV